jgi:small subunit ribosomal protein S8e
MAYDRGRKVSGGKYHKTRKRKAGEHPGNVRVVKLGDKKVKTLRVKGGAKKQVSLTQKIINLINGKKAEKAEIQNVIETPSNRFLARQNVLTKGAIIETNKGKAKITNRPSQEGNIQGILIESE